MGPARRQRWSKHFQRLQETLQIRRAAIAAVLIVGALLTVSAILAWLVGKTRVRHIHHTDHQDHGHEMIPSTARRSGPR